ncbi:MAG: hypothetical protein DRI86_06125 [Bacteroidetes bacterium]|nr:MAG: hypothetical protein DRI86_06125 [Bacteroidota bacterium]
MRRLIIFIGILFYTYSVYATHNRAGEITYKHISGLTYEITVVTYTYSLSPADRSSLVIKWGDGTSSTIQRTQKTALPNYINLNIYKGTHTYSGQGEFIISMEDPNRNGGVTNIPNSINVPFYIETTLNINPFIGNNDSPILLNPPIDNGCVGSPFYHNPGAYDPDGDSLAYELVACKGANGVPIANYQYPAASVSFSIDPITGTLSWINPIIQGEYNVAIVIKEYKNGVLKGSITRDMQITISSCNNRPPVIQGNIDTCVVIGDTLSYVIEATDVDNDIITLRATGGPIIQANNPALFPQPSSGIGYVQSTFSWIPICEHVEKNPYQMIYKAKDNSSPVNLVDIKTSFITVIAPAPENLEAKPKGNKIILTWSKGKCPNALTYNIYRHNGYTGYVGNNCITGVPPWTGYVKIGSTGNSDTTFTDDNNGYGLIHGPQYCYMVVGVFKDINVGAESYPSLEACTHLIKDVPVITNISVDTTSETSGKTTIIWSAPDTINPTQTPGPYKYLIYHNSIGIGQPMLLIDSLNDLNDTIYHHNNINTSTKTNFYRIDLINNTINDRFIIGNTQESSSIFITTEGHTNSVRISWNEIVPWTNYSYIIYRRNQSGIFDSIGNTSLQTYSDSSLVNGNTYCYKIKSIGEYGASGFSKPLINWSQESCAIPIDIEPPCPPILSLTTDCKLIENQLNWTNPNNSCTNDVVAYKLYYTQNINEEYSEIYNPLNPLDTSYLHTGMNNVIGCYYVTAIDSFDNESNASNIECIDIDSCLPYHLPNVFTPNGDGINDLFIPYPYDFVEKVNMTILNRWGSMVFQTKNPDINWDAKDMTTNKDCSEGVYFYICDVYEYRIEGIKVRTIQGTITLYR